MSKIEKSYWGWRVFNIWAFRNEENYVTPEHVREFLIFKSWSLRTLPKCSGVFGRRPPLYAWSCLCVKTFGLAQFGLVQGIYFSLSNVWQTHLFYWLHNTETVKPRQSGPLTQKYNISSNSSSILYKYRKTGWLRENLKVFEK